MIKSQQRGAGGRVLRGVTQWWRIWLISAGKYERMWGQQRGVQNVKLSKRETNQSSERIGLTYNRRQVGSEGFQVGDGGEKGG